MIKFTNYFTDITQNISRGVNLEKNIFAIFTEDSKAQSVAMDFSQKEGVKGIKITSFNNKTYLSSYAFSGLLLGAILGIMLFNIASFFIENGASLLLEGALCGSAIGAITGAFSDIYSREIYENLSSVCMCVADNNISQTIKQLKKRGAIQLYLKKK